MSKNYQKTINACFVGYIVQAIVNTFAPLLFLTFQSQFQIPLSQITLLITINFAVQLGIDFLATFLVDRIGYRVAMIASHLFAAVGLIGLAIFPYLFPSAYAGLLLAVVLYAIGGGGLEVLVSPVVEACPTENKAGTMSLLHSFYCWGQLGVVLFSTLFFVIIGIEHWPILALLWAVLPLLNAFAFTKVPIATLIEAGEVGLSMRALFSNKLFWLFLVMMVCSGASEQAVSQWASAFAEQGLGVTKVVGDLAGPCSFAMMMGLSRTFYGKFGQKIDLERFIILSSLLAICSYLLIGLTQRPILGFMGCALTGAAVGILWPGVFSIASRTIKNGGTAMFAYLALAGDLGCSLGPTLVGFISNKAHDELKIGILAAIIFPIIMVITAFVVKNIKSSHPNRVVDKI